MKTITIAIDAMGGDYAPHSTVVGAYLALKRNSNLKFVFFGDEEKISKILSSYKKLKAVSSIVHTSEYVPSDYSPAEAIRNKKK